MLRAYPWVKSRRIFCLSWLLIYALPGLVAQAAEAPPKIMCRAELTNARRQELTKHLGAITGWPGLHFDDEGVLRFGEEQPIGGSPTARALLASAREGKSLIILEDASGRADVVFCRVIEARWKRDATGKPPAFVVQIDFKDFSYVRGDEAALAAFNSGWGALHEIDHVVHDSVDPEGPGAAGGCEDLINRMRRECGLAERVEYFYTLLPGTEQGAFKTRFVRLAFARAQEQNKRRRYWLFWDAELTGGGMSNINQVAVRRKEPSTRPIP